MTGLRINSWTSCACKFSTKIFFGVLLWPSGVDELQNKLHIESSGTQNSNKLQRCFHRNCCISGPLCCHLSELGDPPIDWDGKMWEGRQTCLLQEFGSKSDKPDNCLLFVTVFLHRVRVCRGTADKVSVSMAESWDRWLFPNTADTQHLFWDS